MLNYPKVVHDMTVSGQVAEGHTPGKGNAGAVQRTLDEGHLVPEQTVERKIKLVQNPMYRKENYISLFLSLQLFNLIRGK